jgi:hypothetical protein
MIAKDPSRMPGESEHEYSIRIQEYIKYRAWLAEERHKHYKKAAQKIADLRTEAAEDKAKRKEELAKRLIEARKDSNMPIPYTEAQIKTIEDNRYYKRLFRAILSFIDWLNGKCGAAFIDGKTKSGNTYRECVRHGTKSWNGATCPYCEDDNFEWTELKRKQPSEQMATLSELFEGYE